jgi:hypothetical protein
MGGEYRDGDLGYLAIQLETTQGVNPAGTPDYIAWKTNGLQVVTTVEKYSVAGGSRNAERSVTTYQDYGGPVGFGMYPNSGAQLARGLLGVDVPLAAYPGSFSGSGGTMTVVADVTSGYSGAGVLTFVGATRFAATGAVYVNTSTGFAVFAYTGGTATAGIGAGVTLTGCTLKTGTGAIAATATIMQCDITTATIPVTSGGKTTIHLTYAAGTGFTPGAWVGIGIPGTATYEMLQVLPTATLAGGVGVAGSGIISTGAFTYSANLAANIPIEQVAQHMCYEIVPGGQPVTTFALATPFATWATGVATFTTIAAHGIIIGDPVTVSGTTGNTAWQGVYTVLTVPTTTTFTVAILSNPGAAPSAGAVARPTRPTLDEATMPTYYVEDNRAGMATSEYYPGVFVDKCDFKFDEHLAESTWQLEGIARRIEAAASGWSPTTAEETDPIGPFSGPDMQALVYCDPGATGSGSIQLFNDWKTIDVSIMNNFKKENKPGQVATFKYPTTRSGTVKMAYNDASLRSVEWEDLIDHINGQNSMEPFLIGAAVNQGTIGVPDWAAYGIYVPNVKYVAYARQNTVGEVQGATVDGNFQQDIGGDVLVKIFIVNSAGPAAPTAY